MKRVGNVLANKVREYGQINHYKLPTTITNLFQIRQLKERSPDPFFLPSEQIGDKRF